MAIVEVKNRDGNKTGSINTNDYVFNNCISTIGFYSFNKNIFPYVKIDNIYYVNDGAAFECKVPNNCATMIHKRKTYTVNDEVYFTEDPLKSFMRGDSSTHDLSGFKIKEVDQYKMQINGQPAALNCWAYRDETSIKDENFTVFGPTPFKFGFSESYTTSNCNSSWFGTNNPTTLSVNDNDTLVFYYRYSTTPTINLNAH